MTDSPDYYAALGVPRTATKDEIKAAFRALALKYHPDRNPGNAEAERLFKQAASAFDVLYDDDRRHRYDTTGHAKPLIDVDLASFDDIVQAFFGSVFGPFVGYLADFIRKTAGPEKEPIKGACKDCDGGGWLPKGPLFISIRKTCGRCRGSGVEPAGAGETEPISKQQLDELQRRVEKTKTRVDEALKRADEDLKRPEPVKKKKGG